jgi:hypothetical protein
MEPVTYMPLTIILGGLILAFIGLAVYVYAFLGVDVKSNKEMIKDQIRWVEERIAYEKDWLRQDVDRLKDLEKKDLDLIFDQSRRLDKLLDYLGLVEKKCDQAEIVKKGK